MSLKNRVDAMIQRLAREDVCVHGFSLSVGGQMKCTAYYAPFREGQPHRLYSVSKSVTALAIGMLMGEGKLKLSDHIADFFTDYLPEKPDARLLKLTIADMLRMATCFRNTAYREGQDDDWTKPFFTMPSTHEPGTVFHYDTGCSQVLAALVRRLSGQECIDYLNEKLFPRIGANDEKYWLRDPSGTCQGGTGLCMSLRDLHKTAQVVMEGGRGIIPGWFAEGMGKHHIPTAMQTYEEETYGYGWQCWRTRAGYAMYGMGGQTAICCPDKDALFCTIADTRLDPFGVQRIYNAFFEEVYPYLGNEDMAFTAYGLETAPLRHHREFTLQHAGPYYFDENMLNLRSIELKGSELVIENARGRNPLKFGLGCSVQDVFPGFPQAPTLCSGGWVSEGLLRVRCHIIGNAPCGVEMLLRFSAQCVTVQARRSPDPVTRDFDGVASGYLKQG